jgi:hypothetical protein
MGTPRRLTQDRLPHAAHPAFTPHKVHGARRERQVRGVRV